MKLLGLFLILLAIMFPAYWFFGLVPRYPDAALFSQYLGATALVSMGIGQFLITRLPGLESVFGGQDRIYVLHKWLAVFALVCLGLHDIIDAEIDGLGRETLIADIAEDVGEIAYYGLLILGIVTITTFIPYHLWRWSHKFVGAFFALGAFHFIFILKPFSLDDLLGMYVLAFCILGLVSYVYMIVFYAVVPGPEKYEVTKIIRHTDIAEITLKPLGRGVRHRAGQFAFIGFEAPDLSEIHPYTISAAASKTRELSFAIKAAGPFTDNLVRSLQVGVSASVHGAFGRFLKERSKSPQIWIAGGIGVTPFLSWLRNNNMADHAPIEFFYCVRGQSETPFIAELKEIADAIPALSFHLVDSASDGRLDAEKITKAVRFSPSKAHVYFCGPERMGDMIRTELISSGLPGSHFHREAFEIRSGINVLHTIKWIKNLFG